MAITRVLNGRNVFSRIALSGLLLLTMAATLHISAFTAQAAQASLSWAATTTNTDGTPATKLAGYKLHIGSASRSYTQEIDVGNSTSYSTSNLVDGSTYYFAVTAYDTSGIESAYSNETTKSFASLPVTHRITATAGGGGTVTALNNSKVSVATSGSTTITSVTVSNGATQAFAIAAAAGYAVSDVKVDGASVGRITSYSFSNVKADHTISATFAATTTSASYSISASATSGGTISPSGARSVTAGGSASYTITPATGYKIAGVSVDGASVGAVATYTFSNVTANHTISATFAAATTTAGYSISASSTAGGTISPAGTRSVSAGGSVTYTITPATGFKIAYVLVDGASKGVASTYTFSNVNANHTIKAGFYLFANNSAGALYAASTGVSYLTDSRYSGGAISSVTTTIPGTNDSKLYQSWRYGNFSYSIPAPNGIYEVKLKFAENLKKAAGQRVFNVLMQGTTVISNLDLYSRAKNAAYDVIIPVTVTNGVLNIKFASVIGNAQVNGILVTAK